MNLIKISLLALGVIGASSCVNNQKNAQITTNERVEQVETTILKKTEIARVIEISTTLQGYQTMNVSPSVTGIIEHIYVEVGDKVKKGDSLVRMDQNQFNTTSLSFSNLQIQMDRMDALFNSGAVSQQTYDQTKLSYDQTKQSLKFLRQNTFVTANFSGVVSAKTYEDGELYSGQPILVITQISTLKALVNIPETYYPIVKKNTKVKLVTDIYPDNVFDAVVEVVYPTIDASSHTFQAKLKIDNSKDLLRPGMYAKTTMSMGKALTMVVPYQSVLKLTGANDRYVYINNEGIASRVFVKLGQRFDEKVEIISDEIKEGDKLVTVGQAKLVDGSKLNIVKEN